MKFKKDDEILIANKLKDKYNCDIIINDEIPYTLYNLKDIGIILEHKNINQMIRNKKKDAIIKIKTKTKGGLQYMNFINLDLFIELLSKSRKEKSLPICDIIDININNYKFSTIENDTLKCIIDTFTGENMKKQYKVSNYYIDLYFEDYNLAIECDESHYNKDYDKNREIEINKILKCTFIRYKPFDINFNIFNLLNKIYLHIK